MSAVPQSLNKRARVHETSSQLAARGVSTQAVLRDDDDVSTASPDDDDDASAPRVPVVQGTPGGQSSLPYNHSAHTPATAKDTGRTWVGTINNYRASQVTQIRANMESMHELGNVLYFAMAEERAPSTGTPHIHFAVLFDTVARMSKIHKIGGFESCWLAVASAHSSWTQRVDYFRKAEDGVGHNPSFWSIGDFPSPEAATSAGRLQGGKTRGAAVQRDWQRAWDQAKSSQFEEMDKSILIPHYTSLLRVGELNKKPWTIPSPHGLWIHGASGSGKSRKARQMAMEIAGDYYNKAQDTHWWCGYNGHKVVIVDDVDGEVNVNTLKLLGDHYSFIAQYKGGSMHIRPEYMWITSNFTIDEVFKENDRAAIKRRYISCTVKDGKLIPDTARPLQADLDPTVALAIRRHVQVSEASLAPVIASGKREIYIPSNAERRRALRETGKQLPEFMEREVVEE